MASSSAEMYALLPQSTVIWDIENIHYNSVPRMLRFVHWVRTVAPGQILAIGNLTILKFKLRMRLQQVNVQLLDTSSRKSSYTDIAIINAVYKLQHVLKPPHHFCFITNDGDFAQLIAQLQEWHYDVSLITQRNGANCVLKALGAKIYYIPIFSN